MSSLTRSPPQPHIFMAYLQRYPLLLAGLKCDQVLVAPRVERRDPPTLNAFLREHIELVAHQKELERVCGEQGGLFITRLVNRTSTATRTGCRGHPSLVTLGVQILQKLANVALMGQACLERPFGFKLALLPYRRRTGCALVRGANTGGEAVPTASRWPPWSPHSILATHLHRRLFHQPPCASHLHPSGCFLALQEAW